MSAVAGPAPSTGRTRLVSGVTVTDVVVPSLFGAIGTAEMVVQGYGPLWASIGTLLLACGLLVLRSRLALVAPLLVTGCYLLDAALGVDISGPASWALPIGYACFLAGLHGLHRAVWTGLVVVLASLAVAMVALDAFTDLTPDVIFGLVWTLAPWVLGQALARAFARNRVLAAEAQALRIREELAVAEAAAEERRRIARELHDVLAHSLSVMVVQASLAEDQVAHDPSAAVRALREVQQCGRNALVETGRLLRLIRDDGDELGMRPQRVLDGLSDLVADYQRSGLSVTLDVDADLAAALPVGLEMSVYRIVQEALTNALKHAPGSPVEVRLVRRGDEVDVDVRNGPSRAPAPARPAPPSGHGLVGVRERVSLFGGTLRAGPTGDGGYRLSATLPVGTTAS